MSTADKLTKAKAGLILDQPFFASLLLGMTITPEPTIKTLDTDGETIRYNPEFLNAMPIPEIVFCLGHEVMHSVFEHMFTRGNRDHKRWNAAGDYIINDILTREHVGIMPDGCLLDSDLVRRGGGTTAGVYDLLPESFDKNPGDDGGALDNVRDAQGDAASIAQKQSDMKVKVIQAANAAKMAGKLSGGLKRLVKELTATKTDWREILRRFLSERAKIDYSFARPKRRFMADDIYLPSLIGEKLGEIVIAIDCSGSIRGAILKAFGAEIKAIIEDTAPGLVRVIYFDTEVLGVDTFGPDDTFKINPIGGGGTAFAPIFEYIDAENLNPSACVVLTDLECNDFGESPACPVLWASIAPGNAPFGEIVLIRE